MLKPGVRHFLFIFIALIIGSALGAYLYQSKMNRLDREANNKVELRVLALRGVFQPLLLQKIEAEKHIKINLIEANDPETLWDLFDAPNGTAYDVVSLMSYQVPAAMQMTRLFAIAASKFDWLGVSSDFRDIPGDPTHNHAVPVLWGLPGMIYRADDFDEAPVSWNDLFENPKLSGKIGVLRSPISIANWLTKVDAHGAERDESSDVGPSEQDVIKDLKPMLKQVRISHTSLSGVDLLAQKDDERDFKVVQMNAAEADSLAPAQKSNWKFTLPQTAAPLWIMALTITSDSKMSQESLRLLNALTEPEMAQTLSQTSHQSSTMLSVEKTALAPLLKPSYLRQVPLTRIKLDHDFQGARAVHAALENLSNSRAEVTGSSTSD